MYFCSSVQGKAPLSSQEKSRWAVIWKHSRESIEAEKIKVTEWGVLLPSSQGCFPNKALALCESLAKNCSQLQWLELPQYFLQQGCWVTPGLISTLDIYHILTLYRIPCTFPLAYIIFLHCLCWTIVSRYCSLGSIMFLFPHGCLSAATEALINYKFSSDGWWLTIPAKTHMSLDVTRLWECPASFSPKHREFWWVFQKYFPFHHRDAYGHLCQIPQILDHLGLQFWSSEEAKETQNHQLQWSILLMSIFHQPCL